MARSGLLLGLAWAGLALAGPLPGTADEPASVYVQDARRLQAAHESGGDLAAASAPQRRWTAGLVLVGQGRAATARALASALPADEREAYLARVEAWSGSDARRAALVAALADLHAVRRLLDAGDMPGVAARAAATTWGDDVPPELHVLLRYLEVQALQVTHREAEALPVIRRETPRVAAIAWGYMAWHWYSEMGGLLAHVLGLPHEAVPLLERALEVRRARAGSEGTETQAQVAIAEARIEAGHAQRGLEELDGATASIPEGDGWITAGEIGYFRSRALVMLGRTAEAQRELTRLSARVLGPDAEFAGFAHLMLANLEAMGGERAAAERHLVAARRVGELTASPRLLLGVQTARVALARLRGELSAALDEARAALELARRSGDPRIEAVALEQAALLWLDAGDPEQAAALAEQARGRVAGDAGGWLETIACALLSSANLERGRPGEAVTSAQQAVKAAERTTDVSRLAVAQLALARALLAAGRPAEALVAARRAAEVRVAVRDATGEVAARLEEGRALARLGTPAEARAAFSRARALGEAAGAHELLAHVAEAELEAWLAAGDREQARAAAERGHAAVARLLRWHSDERRAALRFAWDRLHRLAAQAAFEERPAALLDALERGRSGALLASLGGADGLRGIWVPGEKAQRLAAAVQARETLRAAPEGPTAELLADADRAVREAHDAVEAAVRRRGGLLAPDPVPLATLQPLLAPGDALVLYVAGLDRLAALVVTREAARVVPLGPTAGLAEAVARAWAALATSADELPGSELRERLMDPLALPVGATRLLISPDRPFAALPLALLAPDREVVRVPSATVWAALKARRVETGSGVLALGDPAYADPARRLPASRAEAQAVGAPALVGEQATLAGLTAALASRSRWRTVHLACHGTLDVRNALFSALELAPGPDHDGRWRQLDVLRAVVPADVVVLSACDVGRTGASAGEAVDGLPRAFLLAGAGSVLASVRRVDDAAAAALMRGLYDALARPDGDGRPVPVSRALLEAQRALRAHASSDGTRPYAAPRHWAVWELTGLGE